MTFVGGYDVPLTARFDASNFRIRALAFSPDGSTLWVSLGWQLKPRWFATYLARFDTNGWNHDLYGPVATREYQGDLVSDFFFGRIQPVSVAGVERVVAPAEVSGSVVVNTVLLFDPATPQALERWQLEAKPADAPGFHMHTSDVAAFGSVLAIAGWADGVNQPGESSPRAAVVVVRSADRAVMAGPYVVPTLAGVADAAGVSLPPLRCRWSADGSRVWLSTSEAVWPPDGSPNPNRNAVAGVELASGRTTVSYLPRLNEEPEHDVVLDLLESGGVPILLRLHRSRQTGNWAELVALDGELQPGLPPRRLCADVGWLVYAEPHPTRPGEFVVSATLADGKHAGVIGIVRPEP